MSGAEEKIELDEVQQVKSLTAKEIKALARPEFEANPDKFYPTQTLRRLGFSRCSCVKCRHNFWAIDPKRPTCGDSQCEGKYSFIGRGSGIGAKGKKITYAEAWQGFRKSLSNARVPCTPIDRYPVVARWRADVDYVAAGIFCFQPYCVTGELEPPANPLICPQFCLRFNDLDNIGFTGRHYSGFVMLGIQVFNKPGKEKFWTDDCLEFNYNWLTQELQIPPEEITFIEDVWAGGGNLGPSIEYFVGGLELGNMVFMQYKTFPDGHREELDVKVIDVGIGLERVPWLVNGSPTSYVDVFQTALPFFLSKIKLDINSEIWKKFGPYSCLLNVDEVDDVNNTWGHIAKALNLDVKDIKKAIEPVRDAYMICDHTRTIFMAISDGSLPSNVGGASNIRNLLRRVFSVMAERGWWSMLEMEGFIELFEYHKKDLRTLYGVFPAYKSFRAIIELEYDRWKDGIGEQKKILAKTLQKKKKLDLDDWIQLVTSNGIPAQLISSESKQEIPGNLFYKIAELQERSVKALPTILYSTAGYPETDSLYFKNHHLYEFEGTIVGTPPNVLQDSKPTIVVLDRSSFYPTSGGQEHDTGTLTIKGKVYKVVDVLKVGACVFHVIEPPLDAGDYIGVKVSGKIDEERRSQLRTNHTGTHIVYAAARKTLGSHVWQHGAKKTVDSAHLDITHFQSLTRAEIAAIEREANLIVQRSRNIHKSWMPKDEAEKKYGFNLYQGGVVPGNELRVVNIDGVDTEACCGTHCDNTSEVGLIKIRQALRLSDGIVRLYYVTGRNALDELQRRDEILNSLKQFWCVDEKSLVDTARRFFKEAKTFAAGFDKVKPELIQLRLENLLLDPCKQLVVFKSDDSNPSLPIREVPQFAARLKSAKKGVVFLGESWLYGLLGDPSLFDLQKLEAAISRCVVDRSSQKKAVLNTTVKSDGGKIDGISEFRFLSLLTSKDPKESAKESRNIRQSVLDCLTSSGFIIGDTAEQKKSAASSKPASKADEKEPAKEAKSTENGADKNKKSTPAPKNKADKN